MPKINITIYTTKRYDDILGFCGMEKQTQTKPNLSRQKGCQSQTKPNLSAVLCGGQTQFYLAGRGVKPNQSQFYPYL
jgi:hypothetical protein